jgi:hypothetical protein
VDSIAGKTTAFQAALTVGFSLLWDIRFVIAFSLAGGAAVWGAAERMLKAIEPRARGFIQLEADAA